jgi:hypothetical protein
VKVKVYKQTCSETVIESAETPDLPTEISLTPAQFRAIRADGLRLVVAFEVGAGRIRGEVVKREKSLDAAKVTHPIETTTIETSIAGRYRGVCLFETQKKTAFSSFDFEPE